MKVEDVMVKDVVTVSPKSSVSDAASMMSDKLIGCLVVLSDEKIAGIVTERDILSKVVAEGKDAKKVLVGEVMTSPVECVSPEEELEEAIRKMGDKKIRRLPVVKDGRMTGILTSTDIILSAKSEMLVEIPRKKLLFSLLLGLLCISFFLIIYGVISFLPLETFGGGILLAIDIYFLNKIL